MFVDDAAVHSFRDADPNRSFGNVVNNARTSVVVLEGHALDLRRIYFNIHVITDFVRRQIRRQLYHTPLPERTGEHVPGPAPITK